MINDLALRQISVMSEILVDCLLQSSSSVVLAVQKGCLKHVVCVSTVYKIKNVPRLPGFRQEAGGSDIHIDGQQNIVACDGTLLGATT